jgi:hypothetical protein
MSAFRKASFLAALMLLLVVGADLGVDMAYGTTCDGNDGSQTSGTPSDECFCCCVHIVMPVLTVSMPVQNASLHEVFNRVQPPSIEQVGIFHPPRT